MDGEEVGNEGRAFAHAEDGTSYELASLGKSSCENPVANPATGKATVVAGTDDTTPGQVYVYVGDQEGVRATRPSEPVSPAARSTGSRSPASRSSPTNTGIPSGTAFTAANLGDVSARRALSWRR